MLNTTQLTVRVAAVQGAYGHRLATYATQVSPRSLEAFLGHDPRSRLWKKLDPGLMDIYQQLQRTTTAERLKSIQSYIRKRLHRTAIVCGGFPAISVAVTRPLRFQPFDSGNDVAGAGTLHLDMSKSNVRVVLDGLARVSSVIELVETASDGFLDEAERKAIGTLLDEFSLPVIVFAPREDDKPLEMRELKQLFADFNFKQVSISSSIAIAMDSSDIYIEATRKLGETSFIRNFGGVEVGRASLGSKSTALVVQANLLRFVRAAAEGDRFVQASANVDKTGNARLTDENLLEFTTNLEVFLQGIAAGLGEAHFSDTKNGVHLSGPGWSALGVIFYDLDATLKINDFAGVSKKIGAIDGSRGAEFWSDVMREKNIRGKKVMTFMGGGTESRQAIRRKVHQFLGTWDDLQQAFKRYGRQANSLESADVA